MKFWLILSKYIKNKLQPNFGEHALLTWQTGSQHLKLRLLMVIIGFLLFYMIICYKLLFIANYNLAIAKNLLSNEYIQRKEIADREGNLLAVNVPGASLFANPRKVINPDHDLKKISTILPGLDIKRLLLDFKKNKNFIWIKRDITPKEQAQIFNLGIPGFDFEREQRRIYIFPNLLSHVLGYVGRDFTGLAGIEKTYNSFLSETAIDEKKLLSLSIDVRLQSILSEEIDKTIKEFNAIGGVGIIANPNNGEILALVSKPDFNPHSPAVSSPEQLFNRASLGVNEMGSVFKALTLAVGFDVNSITMKDVYDLSFMKVGKFKVKDYHTHNGWHTVPEIFLHSSNIGVSQIILEVGKDNFRQYLKQLGLLDQLKIELPERATPLYPSAGNWNDLSLTTMSYGYGLSISPLHFVQAILPVVNGGYFYPLTLIKDRKLAELPKQVFKSTTSSNMNKLLRLVVQQGTGRKAEVNGYFVGGKTGTAEKLINGVYQKKDKRVSSFIGVMPATSPEYVIYVMIDEPKGIKETYGLATAGWTAAPLVSRIFERMVALYGLSPVDPESAEAKEIINFDIRIENAT